MEGYRAGTYVRLELQGVPCELVANFDPRFPILVGGLGQAEEAVGYMTVRAKSLRSFRLGLQKRCKRASLEFEAQGGHFGNAQQARGHVDVESTQKNLLIVAKLLTG